MFYLYKGFHLDAGGLDLSSAIRSTLAARNIRGWNAIAHWKIIMNESTHIEDFSALDDWAPVIPEWQAFRPEAYEPCSIKEDCAD